MAQKKYVSLSKLSTFLENLKDTFSTLSHKHTLSDITDYKAVTVDSSLSPTSTNPVQNKILDAEFDAISEAMGALEAAIDDRVAVSELSTAVDDALSQAKTSGEFDGEDGYTPVRGTDYWTNADKEEIKAYVDDAILNGEW